MAKVVLASALARWLPAAADGETTLDVAGDSVGAALEAVFARHPVLRGYVLDERGAVRRHVALFVDGEALQPKSDMARPLRADTELVVMRALSGG
jgi:molybdopterin synthase sulfur carrier subunit